MLKTKSGKTLGTALTADGSRRLLTDRDVADQLRISTSTLAKWRMRGHGPAFVKLIGRVAYQQADVDAFVAASVQRSSQASA